MQKKSLTKTKAGGRELSTKAEPVKMPTAAAPIAKSEPVTIKPSVAKPAASTPTREAIARRAFEIYMGRGQAPGRELEDWAQAERELSEKSHRNN